MTEGLDTAVETVKIRLSATFRNREVSTLIWDGGRTNMEGGALFDCCHCLQELKRFLPKEHEGLLLKTILSYLISYVFLASKWNRSIFHYINCVWLHPCMFLCCMAAKTKQLLCTSNEVARPRNLGMFRHNLEIFKILIVQSLWLHYACWPHPPKIVIKV